MQKKRIAVGIILISLILAATAQETESTGISNLIREIKQTNTRITKLQTQFTADITDVHNTLSDKIDSLFTRIALLVIASNLLIVGAEKTIGGLVKYRRKKKQTKAAEKNNTLMEELIPLLKTLNTEAIKQDQAEEPDKKPSRINLNSIIIAGVIAILVLLILNKLGVIG